MKPEDMFIKTTMKEVILDHLKKHNTITSAIAMEKYRCLNLYSVVRRLRDDGWNISRSSTRQNSDFNVASNRNSSYIVYTLENKTRKKPVYKISYICLAMVEDIIPKMVDTHESYTQATMEVNKIADLMANHLNLFYGNSLVEFIKVVDTECVMVVKKETIKKLFKKKYDTTFIAKFVINKEEVEL